MSILKILTFPHPNLRIKAQKILEITPEIKQLSQDMLETMYAANGIGLAATQVDIHQQLVVMDLSESATQKRYSYVDKQQNSQIDLDKPLILINPEISILNKELAEFEEGCLSVPGINVLIKRSSLIGLSALTLEGDEINIEADGLLATCMQHEVDHLQGKLFIDYLSLLKRVRIRKILTKKIK